jgi:RNA polymerase sigma-70 factor (ECF subfamily)
MATYNSYTDVELTDLLKSGNHAAYTEIYDRYSGLLYIFAYKRLRDREKAKDLVHDLFLTLWANHESLFFTSSLPAYLYSSVRNKIINIITHNKIEEQYIDSFKHYMDNLMDNKADHLTRHNELNSFIESEIAALSPRMRLVFELSRKSNLTRKEIADRLNISEETAKSQLHCALKILKVKLSLYSYFLF